MVPEHSSSISPATGRRISAWVALLIISFTFSSTVCDGQRTRLSDYNTLGWYTYNGDHTVSEKWQIHTEYQWRRVDVIRRWQQSLARLGLTHSLSDNVSVSGGYTYFTTFPYGDYPQAELGEPYSEHRSHEDIQLKSRYGRLDLSHRFRLEQRWLAMLSEVNPRRVSEWVYQNRVRYQVAGVLPLRGPTLDDGEWYLNFFDELFIGFGPNVGENVYNQNRISGGIGYQFTDNVTLELNYLNQIVLHADPYKTTGQPVFEYNNGFRFNVNYSLDFTRR